MERKNEVVSIHRAKGSLLVDDRAACDFSASCGILVDGFDSI